MISGEKEGVGFAGIDIDVFGCERRDVVAVGFYDHELVSLPCVKNNTHVIKLKEKSRKTQSI